MENRKKLRKVRDEFEEMPLPKTHEEFLAMSALYTFIEEIDQYFAVKQGFEGLDIKKGKVIQK